MFDIKAITYDTVRNANFTFDWSLKMTYGSFVYVSGGHSRSRFSSKTTIKLLFPQEPQYEQIAYYM